MSQTEKFTHEINAAMKSTIMSYVAKSIEFGNQRGKCFRLRLPFWFENRYFYVCVHNIKWKPNKWKCSFFHYVECGSDVFNALRDTRDREFSTKNLIS